MVKEMHSALKFNKIGKWWHKGAEIDIVAFDEAGKKAIFAECKWKDTKLTLWSLPNSSMKKQAWLNGTMKKGKRYLLFLQNPSAKDNRV